MTLRAHMMDCPLMISDILVHAANCHGDQEIVTRLPESGQIHRQNYAQTHERTKQLANALQKKLKVREGDRVATIAWNSHRHFELYYAISGVGAVVHTVNPRLDPKQLIWMLDHAQSKTVFFDKQFAPLIDAISKACKSVKNWVLMTDKTHLDSVQTKCKSYEELIADYPSDFDWPVFDEFAAAGLCYTSGTTGDPKGVLYSHRSNVLHAMASASADVIGVGARGTLLPVVPMFHVNAWGIPYAAPMNGAKLVMPGAQMDGPSIHELIESENVSYVAGVPTVWLGLLNYLETEGKRIDTVDRVLIGGSALPEALLRAYEDKYGVVMQQGWGMTEMSPLGTVNSLLPKHDGLDREEVIKIKLKQGRLVFGVGMRIVDDEGKELPWDGKSSGHVQVRGPWIASGYYRGAGAESFTEDGWFETGDVAHLDGNGFMTITDRSKDVIKTGGEWISSIDLENAAMGHPSVAMAAAVGMPHPKWQERPLMVVQLKEGAEPNAASIIEYLRGEVPKWWLPDAVEFIDEMPIGATGKILKTKLREIYKDYEFPTVDA
ncbi:long-chain-fatty-acid--CoA ligase [uncultured Maricaulis sp.]|uniref:long-chain-fatty-acid--CoA ligase n=1 Tax=uncultured Maricaulis sp. TaxID=174710 RepID=UPI00261F1540|nr:long-chain-fatty-acid--CoA ligase [uncultured Maricaulis sp.]